MSVLHMTSSFSLHDNPEGFLLMIEMKKQVVKGRPSRSPVRACVGDHLGLLDRSQSFSLHLADLFEKALEEWAVSWPCHTSNPGPCLPAGFAHCHLLQLRHVSSVLSGPHAVGDPEGESSGLGVLLLSHQPPAPGHSLPASILSQSCMTQGLPLYPRISCFLDPCLPRILCYQRPYPPRASCS